MTVSGDTSGDVYLGNGDDTLTVLPGVTLSGNVSGGSGGNTFYYGAPEYGTITGTVN